MIHSKDDFMKHDYRKPIEYIKRPNYFVYELYRNHFGDNLLETTVSCRMYDIRNFKNYNKEKILVGGKIEKYNLLSKAKWENRFLTGVTVKEINDILYIEFENPTQGNYFHTTKSIPIEPNTMYMVSGFIKTQNLDDNEGVCLEVQDIRGWNATHFAVATKKVKGTNDWIHVERVFETLPDSKGLRVIARRNSNELPVKGKVYFKDVQLYKYIPKTTAPYLSVNASKNEDGSKVYLMVINKNIDEGITAIVDLKDFNPSKKGNIWILNGPSIDETNEKKTDNIKVVNKKFTIKENPFQFTFEPHSLTAIEIEKGEE
jgi:alpha-L-arabinofuranosidase